MPDKATDYEIGIQQSSESLLRFTEKQGHMTDEEASRAYTAARKLFRLLLTKKGVEKRKIDALLTKFNDAGPRSAPWKPVSSKVPGRPQDGSDGNRIQRWKLPKDHKFYSTKVDGILVAIKYILQTLSMDNAPEVPAAVSSRFNWLTGNEVVPGRFLDPIQRTPVSIDDFIADPRLVTSGHINPLDRGGRHVPENTSLLLKISNDLQGNNTIAELLILMQDILGRHGRL